MKKPHSQPETVRIAPMFDDDDLGRKLQMMADTKEQIRLMQHDLRQSEVEVLQVLMRDKMFDFFRVDYTKLNQAFRINTKSGK